MNTNEAKWNETKITNLLDANPVAVERAIVAIYNLQTTDEQSTESTNHRNGAGFSACHAGRGTYFAKWIISGKHLTGHHLETARTMAKHYKRQLLNLANAPKVVAVPQSTIGPFKTEAEYNDYLDLEADEDC